MSIDEINRIKESCSLNKEKDQEIKAQQKKELYEKSQQRVKNWPNTIQAMRKKKDEERIKRLENEEVSDRFELSD